MQWKSGKEPRRLTARSPDKRAMEGGKAGVTAEGSKAGDTYTVTSPASYGRRPWPKARPCPSASLSTLTTPVVRFHHISFGCKLLVSVPTAM